MLTLLGTFKSKTDGTIKCVFKNEEDKIMELSLLRNKRYDVLSVPTHYSCNLGCQGCDLKTPNMDDEKIEITDLLEAIYKTLIHDGHKRSNKKSLMLSFMGMGDALLNFDLLLDTFNNEERLKSIGYNYINYSFNTLMPKCDFLAIQDEINSLNIPLKIYFNPCSTQDDKRAKSFAGEKISIDESCRLLSQYRDLIINNKEIMKSFKRFHSNLNPAEVIYPLKKNINDTLFECSLLEYYLSRYNLPIKFIVDLKDEELKMELDEWLNLFQTYYPDMPIKIQNPVGKDIGVTCDEHISHYYGKEEENFDEWYKEHIIAKNTKEHTKKLKYQ